MLRRLPPPDPAHRPSSARLRRTTSLALRRPRLVLLTWVVIAVLGIVATGALFSSLDTDLNSPASFESEQVGHRLDQLDPHGGSVAAIVEGAQVPDATIAKLQAVRGVASVQHGPSSDGAAIGIGVELRPNLSDGAENDAVATVASTLRGIDAPKVLVGGELLVDREFSDRAEKDAQRAELISLPIAIIVMAIVFGGIVAASLPLALAFGGVFATMIALGLVASVTDVSLYALNVVMMLGIGLGIDYGLLMVSRFREERGAGYEIPDAVRRTMASSGRTVVFSACTVAAALSSLLVFQDATMRSLGIAGITVVLACMIAALTLLPALLGRFGHRLGTATKAADEGFFARLARLISRRAGLVVVLVSLVLLTLAAPFLSARFDKLDVRALPKSSETRQVAEAVDQRFPGVTQEPVWAIAYVDRDDPAVVGFVRDIRALDGVRTAEISDMSRAGLTAIQVSPDGETNGPISERVVSEVRGVDAPFRFQVGGDPAETVDYRHGLESRLPFAIAIVVIATFILLFLMTSSVVLPFKAIVMNVLSLGATFGALVWIFQDGHLASLLGFDPPGALDLIMPVVVFVFAFGLSMDYEVFMLARIKEAYDETGDNDAAVAIGLQRSGKIITSAALLIVIVFAGFTAGEIVAMKQLGLGLALAVVIDATIVRCLLVPATMKLMGKWNWWAPKPLARLHAKFGLPESLPVDESSRTVLPEIEVLESVDANSAP
jgi:RND superfamily putative drug exporter